MKDNGTSRHNWKGLVESSQSLVCWSAYLYVPLNFSWVHNCRLSARVFRPTRYPFKVDSWKKGKITRQNVPFFRIIQAEFISINLNEKDFSFIVRTSEWESGSFLLLFPQLLFIFISSRKSKINVLKMLKYWAVLNSQWRCLSTRVFHNWKKKHLRKVLVRHYPIAPRSRNAG